ncbi:AraC family transcriptional regulator [bacterium]|nr:MAG: AraC family transcriptional regulator [bacterium]
MQRPRNPGQLIKEIERILTEQISDPSLNVSRIATLLGVSTQTIYQCTYKCFCEPPKTILDLYRLVCAMRMIKASPDMNLTLIAHQSGYNDYQTFSQCL